MNNSSFQPLSFGGIVDKAFKIYSQDFVSLVMLSLLFNLPVLFLQIGIHTTSLAREPELMMIASIVTIILSMVCSSMLTGATMQIVSARYLGDRATFSEAMGRTTPILGKIISTSLLVGVWIFLGCLLLLVPGILWMFTLSLALPAVVLEGKSGSEALTRSKEMVNYDRSKVVSTIIGLGLLTFILGAVFGGLWYGGLAAAGAPADGLLALTGETFLGYLIGPVYNLALVILYYDLRVRHEGYDLELLSQEME